MLNMTIEVVTPESAKRYLERNTENRRLRNWWVNSLAGCMRRGEWITTNQGVSFDTTGKLIDGQHKLEAVILADMPVTMAVFRNLDPSAFKVLDIGVKRNYSDITGLDKRTAEVCRYIARVLWSGAVNSADQILKVADAGVSEVHQSLLDNCGATVATLSSAPIRVMVTMLLLEGHSIEYIHNLYSNLVNQRYSSLPPIGEAFLRQVNRGIVTPNNKPDLSARALKVFDYRNEQFTKLVITPADLEEPNILIRKIMKSLLGSL